MHLLYAFCYDQGSFMVRRGATSSIVSRDSPEYLIYRKLGNQGSRPLYDVAPRHRLSRFPCISKIRKLPYHIIGNQELGNQEIYLQNKKEGEGMRGLGFAEGRGRRPRPRQTLNPDCPSPDIMRTTANHSNLSIKSMTYSIVDRSMPMMLSIDRI